MWVDETGGADATATGSEDMTITVEGEEYSAEVNFDINEDGVEDTAVVEQADGSAQAFVDADGDGDADEYVKLDAQGEVVAHAEYDVASGDWVAVDPGASSDDSGTEAGSSGPITADMPGGEVEVGPPTVDTNDDGVNDTAVVKDESGNTIGFTDVDGDGEADVAVVISPSGESTTYEHSGDGQWTEVGSSGPGDGAMTQGAAAGAEAAGAEAEPDGWGGGVEGVARIDSATGQWISQN